MQLHVQACAAVEPVGHRAVRQPANGLHPVFAEPLRAAHGVGFVHQQVFITGQAQVGTGIQLAAQRALHHRIADARLFQRLHKRQQALGARGLPGGLQHGLPPPCGRELRVPAAERRIPPQRLAYDGRQLVRIRKPPQGGPVRKSVFQFCRPLAQPIGCEAGEQLPLHIPHISLKSQPGFPGAVYYTLFSIIVAQKA